jgi:hypothetical protein
MDNSYNTNVDGLNSHHSTEVLDKFTSERMEPNSEPEPISQQRDTDLTPHVIVETTAEKVIEKPGSVRLISERRVRDEKLEWLKPMIAGDNLSYEHAVDLTQDLYAGRCKIVDADGVVYDGILGEDGTVDEGWFGYDSPKTFEYFSRYKDEYNSLPKDASREPSFVYVAETCLGKMHYLLRQEKTTGQLFLHSYHRQVSPSDFIAAVATVQQLASWLFDLHEQRTVIFPQTGHLVVNLPEELRWQIERLAGLAGRSERDWIVERLTECTQDERSIATLAKEQELRSSRDATAKEIIERLKERQAAALKAADNEVARQVDETEPRRKAE